MIHWKDIVTANLVYLMGIIIGYGIRAARDWEGK